MDAEKYFAVQGITGKVQKIIAPKTAEALKLFCSQSREFAQAVEQSDKTFQDCLDSINKSVNKRDAVSDLDVVRMAAEFYFMGAKICYEMHIDLGESDSISVSLDSLLDF